MSDRKISECKLLYVGDVCEYPYLGHSCPYIKNGELCEQAKQKEAEVRKMISRLIEIVEAVEVEDTKG